MKTSTIEQIAKTCHAAHVAYCSHLEQKTQSSDFVDVPQAHKEIVYDSIQSILSGKFDTASAAHNNFVQLKISQGWSYSETYDIEKKQNPRLKPFDALTQDQKAKDLIFFSIVKSFAQ